MAPTSLTPDLPKCPVRDNRTNVPRFKGKVRGEGDSFEYQDPVDKTWKPAVRLVDIRARLVQEEPTSKYTHKKECGFDATDVTTFLEKDKDYGGERDHRPDLLFKILPTGFRGQSPKGYMKDRDRIVLDAFDHGIRDFSGILPKAISSEVGGHDLVYYLRQNKHMQFYDIIARQPDGYNEQDGKGKVTWHQGTPRYGTIGMRATRFRLQVGLLSWKMRMGSDIRNEHILKLIPDECKDPQVNSTKSFRDLTLQEQNNISKILAGTAPGRKRNFKKEEVTVDSTEDKNVNEGEGANVTEREVPNTAQTLQHAEAYLSPNTATFMASDNDGERYIDRESDSSSSDSEKPLTKRRYTKGPTRGQKPFLTPAIGTFKVNKHPRRSVPLVRKALRNATSGVDPKGNMNTAGEGQSNACIGLHQSDSSKRGDVEEAHGKPKKRSEAFITLPTANAIQGNDPIVARMAHATMINSQAAVSPSTASGNRLPDNTGRDFRKVIPSEYPETLEDNVMAIEEALAITRFHFKKLVGFLPPASVENHDGSYCMRASDLQKQLSQSLYQQNIPSLYILNRWEGSFRNWKIEEKDAQDLWMEMHKGS